MLKDQSFLKHFKPFKLTVVMVVRFVDNERVFSSMYYLKLGQSLKKLLKHLYVKGDVCLKVFYTSFEKSILH